MIQISEKTKQEMNEKFTKYEIARILGARALQLAMNAPLLLKLSKEDLEKINFDPLKIAELEFYAGVLPITVKRPLPSKREEAVRVKEKPKELMEEKKEKAPEEEKVEEEAIDGEKIIDEVKESEIMELAVPEDEEEEEVVQELEE
jgi:DNA-directed RNA polymerase subunit K